ncbi:response regulator transcription factor [Mucilaginibacter sp. OK283]|jgi:DNA-binding NarL/FixJ family response regulator|uniref:response regulator transcription factor n=1 Tax=Mucilaginibacter sp. OK283 TaxID=1881049 RepID=UPI0008C8C237|nr:response regulator transcription factor [Mucilaginibacter sp. OK283]SEO50968.1 two component transcriptional regulator, LuxR family [Mucilaginibacter sp. OK283]
MLYDKKIKLAIVDDHNLFRKGIIKLITLADKGNKYEILFEAESGEDLKTKINIAELPDIILMDIDMPDMNGYEAVEWLNKCYPDIPVLIISMFEKEEGVLRMLRLGIKGYLSKDIEVEDINRALEAIVNKGYFYSGFVSDIITKQLNDKNSNTVNAAQINKTTFTEVELTLIKLACTELTYLQIADKMNISPKTVDGYRDNLFRKLGVKSRVGLAMYAVQHGIVNK